MATKKKPAKRTGKKKPCTSPDYLAVAHAWPYGDTGVAPTVSDGARLLPKPKP